jgi:hypothetical protein
MHCVIEVSPYMYGFRVSARKRLYHADITSAPNNEFGFYYLRDNVKFHVHEMGYLVPARTLYFCRNGCFISMICLTSLESSSLVSRHRVAIVTPRPAPALLERCAL